MSKPIWTPDRLDELAALGTLLREVSSINHGNNCLERIARCIALAAKLTHTDFVDGKVSFHEFLRASARAEYAAQAKATGEQIEEAERHAAGASP